MGTSSSRTSTASRMKVLLQVCLAALIACSAYAGRSVKGDYKFFVRWDYDKCAGRYFETNAYQIGSTEYAYVHTHDDGEAKFLMADVYHLGTTPEVGDVVIAYWEKGSRSYAFQGYATRQRGDSWYVKFADAGAAWIDDQYVHKMVSMAKT